MALKGKWCEFSSNLFTCERDGYVLCEVGACFCHRPTTPTLDDEMDDLLG